LAQDEAVGGPEDIVISLGIYGITLLLVGLRWNRFMHAALRNKLLLLLVGIALVSVFWSVLPRSTLLRGGALVGQTLFGVYLAIRYSLREQLHLWAWMLGIAALLSLLFALALPSYGLFADPRGYSWRGIYLHKNYLGMWMTLSALVFFLLATTSSPRHRWLLWGGFGLSVGLLLLSKSATGLVVFVTLLILLPLYRALRWHYTLSVPIFIGAVLVGGGVVIALLGNMDTVLDILGRDVTLTGRTVWWRAALVMIWERPWLGYGYGAFWDSGEIARFWAMTDAWFIPGLRFRNAHNGFIDLWLELGLLGLSVFALGFLLAFRRAVAWVRLTKTAEGFLPLVYLTFMLLYSFVERTLLFRPFWALYVSMVFSIFYVRTKARTITVDPDGLREP
jgi:O-antigen ligase